MSFNISNLTNSNFENLNSDLTKVFGVSMIGVFTFIMGIISLIIKKCNEKNEEEYKKKIEEDLKKLMDEFEKNQKTIKKETLYYFLF